MFDGTHHDDCGVGKEDFYYVTIYETMDKQCTGICMVSRGL